MTRISATAARPALIRFAALIALAAIAMVRPAGAQVVVLVNGQPITAYDIEQRSRLMQLATHKAPSRQQVIDELIDDKLKLDAAKRYSVEISDSDVDNAFANMARSARASPEQFAKGLAGAGIDANSLKARLRADIAWAQIVRGKFQSSLQVGERDILAALETRKKEDDDVGYEYTLYPIMFVVPRGSPQGLVETRMREAEALRARFQSCNEGLPFARALRDVAVREPVRRNSADLAPQLRATLDKVPVGSLTSAEVTSGGIELFAVCDKKQVTTDTPGKRQVREELFSQRFQQQAKRYLKELRQGAMIEMK
jgi:peptidyl-prolyl cis-trans isomerase SurA